MGALLGANARFAFYKKLEQLNLEKDLITLVINTFSSFIVGFFISYLSRFSSLNISFQLVLFFQIGFLGSLSTFSTFIYDLFDSSLKIKFFRALKSLSLGIISVGLGLLFSN